LLAPSSYRIDSHTEIANGTRISNDRPGCRTSRLRCCYSRGTARTEDGHRRKEALGGVCLNVGCIPSKALLTNAEIAHTLKHRDKEFGFSFENLELDYAAAFKRSRQVSSRLVKGVGFLMKKNNIDVYEGVGRVKDRQTLQVALNDGNEEELKFENLVLAVGAHPRAIPGIEIDGERVITYLEAIMSDTVPERAIIVGAGPIGMEFAYVWANYGVEVTIVEMLPHLLPNEDPEISDVIEKAYRKLGIKFFTDTAVQSAEVTDSGVRATLGNGETVEADQMMVAIGFKPNVESLGLEGDLELERNQWGGIAVDEGMRTSIPNIYAAGDLVAPEGYMFAHHGSAMGIVAAETIAGHPTVTLDYRMLPRATYCVRRSRALATRRTGARKTALRSTSASSHSSPTGRRWGSANAMVSSRLSPTSATGKSWARIWSGRT
jgi:dihydrolipoamide dehydrogenase